MEQYRQGNSAALKDAQVLLRREECARDMALRPNYAALIEGCIRIKSSRRIVHEARGRS